MKTIKCIIVACFTLSFLCGYSRSLSQEEAVLRVKNSYQYKYFRNPTDTLANLNNFIEEIDKIVPMNNQKKNALKKQVMVAVRQQTDKKSLSEQIFYFHYTQDKIIYVIGTNVIDVIKNNFSEDEITRIHESMDKERFKAFYAYSELGVIYAQKYKKPRTRPVGVPATREEVLEISRNLPSQKEKLDRIYEEFNID
jgi:hypothetical protein